MSVTWKDWLKETVSVGGTGALTLGAASSGFQAFAAGDDGKLFPYSIQDGTAWETGTGTYTHAGTSFARTNRDASSTGAALNVTTNAFLFVDAVASVLQVYENNVRLDSTEVSVTGATTATIGKMHICTGTSADYTISLPAASGNAGKLLGFRMGTAATLTKLVTLDGNASETIDGALTRIMWSFESALLWCDGSNWFKIAGKTIPMVATVSLGQGVDQVIANTTVTKVLVDTIVDDAGGMCDVVTNHRINIKRPGTYLISGAVAYGTSLGVGFAANASRVISKAQLDGSDFWNSECSTLAGGFPTPFGVRAKTGLTTTDYFELSGYQNNGGSHSIYGTAGLTFLSAAEVPIW